MGEFSWDYGLRIGGVLWVLVGIRIGGYFGIMVICLFGFCGWRGIFVFLEILCLIVYIWVICLVIFNYGFSFIMKLT